MAASSCSWRFVWRGSVAIGCSSYLIVSNPPVLDAGPVQVSSGRCQSHHIVRRDGEQWTAGWVT